MTPPDDVPDAPAEACRTAREMIERFRARRLSVSESRAFRAHLSTCTECRDIYRMAISSRAELGRAVREARQEEAIRRARRDGRQRAFRAGTPARRRLFGLRLVLVPALLIVMMMQVQQLTSPAPPLYVSWEEGEVNAGPLVLGPRETDGVLVRGDWCHTRGHSRAIVEGEAVRLTMGDTSTILVESTDETRIRFTQGSLIIDGTCEVSSPLGFVTVQEALVHLDLTRELLTVSCQEGQARVLYPGGKLDLAQSESIHLSMGGPYLP